MADETNTLTADEALDAELAALFGTTEPAAPAAAAGTDDKPDSSKQVDPAASPDPSAKPEENEFLKALEAIEEEKPEEPKPDEPKAALSDDQKTVLEAIPDAKALENLSNVLSGYTNFTDALQDGKFDDVEGMLKNWHGHPEILDKFHEHMYQKYVANGDWVDRFIKESENPQSKEVIELRKRLATIESQMVEKKVTESKMTAEQTVAANIQNYNKFVDELFVKAPCPDGDKEFIVYKLNHLIANDPKALAAVRAGDFKRVPTLFKAAGRAYLSRDKQATQAVEKKIEVQDKKVPPINTTGGATNSEDPLPDDINKVAAKDADKWSDRMLDKLFKR